MHQIMVELKPTVKSEKLDGSMEVMATRREKDEGRSQEEALLRQQTAVARLGQLALTIANLSELLNEATVLVCQTLNVESAQVWEYTEDGKSMRRRGGEDWQEKMVEKVTVDNKACRP